MRALIEVLMIRLLIDVLMIHLLNHEFNISDTNIIYFYVEDVIVVITYCYYCSLYLLIVLEVSH